jgi:hypothetical protein
MRPRLLIAAAALFFGTTAALVAQRPDAFTQSRDHAAIAYTRTAANDPVARLDQKLADGSVTLPREPVSGYLRSILAALQVPIESQMLVFSQTSLQASQISFLNPRALFFNDDVQVGWVRGSDTLELTGRDPRQGVIFYTLDQSAAKPRFTRENQQCMTCHLSWDTLAVPGLTALSTYPLPDDKNAYANGFTTDHRSPFSERWGGWFVTGQHGQSRHMGNIPVMPADKGKSKIANPLRVLPSVEGLFDTSGYPARSSDVVALLVFDHQAHMTNLLTRIGWEARVAAAQPQPGTRVRDAANDLVDYMLFGDEAPLPGKVQGSAGFAEKFAALGPRDSKGRSLRDFDLERRLFKYPCSYVIYSEAFDALPAPALEAVYARLYAVLTGKETSPALKRLTPAERTAILEILRETKKNLPGYFTPATA